ncbi:hypothetical protein ABPG73_006874 [Tetrahymena malaccensis]
MNVIINDNMAKQKLENKLQNQIYSKQQGHILIEQNMDRMSSQQKVLPQNLTPICCIHSRYQFLLCLFQLIKNKKHSNIQNNIDFQSNLPINIQSIRLIIDTDDVEQEIEKQNIGINKQDQQISITKLNNQFEILPTFIAKNLFTCSSFIQSILEIQLYELNQERFFLYQMTNKIYSKNRQSSIKPFKTNIRMLRILVYQLLTFVICTSNNDNLDYSQSQQSDILRFLSKCGQYCKCTDLKVSVCSSCQYDNKGDLYFPDKKACDMPSKCNSSSQTKNNQICCPNYCKTCTRNNDDYICQQCQDVIYRTLTIITAQSIRSSQMNENIEEMPNVILRFLQKCGQYCKCNDPKVSVCSSCQYQSDLYYPDKKACDMPSKCNSSSQTKNNQICCPNYCKTCTRNNDDYVCQQCLDGYFLTPPNTCNKCDSNCVTCIDSDKNYGICNICHSSCLQCKGESDQDCLKCQPGLYFLANGKCGVCPDVGFYKFEGRCIQCDSSCSTCNGSTKYDCLSCSYPYSYFDQSHQCQRCHSDCESCIGGNKNECLKCLDKSLFISLKNQNCERCQENEFNDGVKCIKCLDHCQTCSSSNTCEKCEKGYFYKDNQCSPCDTNCLSCSGHLKCDVCAPNFKLYDGICFNCKEGEYLDSDTKQCETCHPKCKSCFGKTEVSCIKCANPLEFFDEDNYCVDKCKEGYIRNPIRERCQKCVYFKTDKNKLQCILDCPLGYFADSTNVCQKCGPYCLKCQDKDTCIQCDAGLSLMSYTQKVCVKCKADEFADENNTCQKCQIQNCETCQSKTICQTCSKTFKNKSYYCEYDNRYDNYSCLHDKAEQCEKELELITKVDVSTQSIQISSIALQSASALLLQSGGSFLYSIQMQQVIGNMKLAGDFKVVSLGFTFLELSYQMNFINLIPSPLNLETQNDSNQNKNQKNLQSKRSLSESDVSSSNIKLIRSQNLSKIFLNNVIIYVIIIIIVITILAICKLLKSKFQICETIDSRNRSYVIRLQLIFSNFILISAFNSLKNAEFSCVVSILSFVFSIVYLMCYILFLVFFYLKVSAFKKLDDMNQVDQYYVFVENLNLKNRFQKYFWLFFEMKKILNLLFISFISIPSVSLSLVLLINLSFLLYMIRSKPVLVLHELRYYYTLETLQILINLFVLLTAIYQKEQLAWSAIAFMGVMFVINVFYAIYQIYKTIKIKWFKERFIVSKTTFYEEELRKKNFDNTLNKSQLKIKILKKQQTTRQEEFTNSSTINDSRTIEYLDNIHQLSIKWNKNPIFTRQTLFSDNFKL